MHLYVFIQNLGANLDGRVLSVNYQTLVPHVSFYYNNHLISCLNVQVKGKYVLKAWFEILNKHSTP